MSGFLTNGVPTIAALSGAETLPIDTNNVAGENPESGSVTSLQLAIALRALSASIDHATVSGTRYIAGFNLGVEQQLNGISVLIGTVGGTDKWIVELHNAAGAVVAHSDLTGVTVGTAATWQSLFFGTQAAPVPYIALPGQYYLVLQANGTTAKYATLTAANLPIVDGSVAGVFGTLASITPPTTYTASLAPVAQVF